MKRLIFDLDNTLIIWKDEYVNALIKTMNEFNINIDYNIINDIIEKQEKIHETLKKETLLNDINKETNLDIKIDFIDKLIDNQKELSYKDEEVINTLEYLKNKYDLIVLTNYFKEAQIGRLKKAEILKYFSQVIGGDEILFKPRLDAFNKGIGTFNKNDVTMIGDSIEYDINGAKRAGIKAILVDYKNKYKNLDYDRIEKFSDLKKHL